MEPNVETLELINNEVDSRLSRQREGASRVDIKATGLLTLLLASVPLGLWTTWSWYVFPARLLVLLSAAFAIWTLAVRSYWNAPIPRTLVEKYAAQSKVDLLEVLVGTKVVVFERNARIYARKSRCWRIAVICLTVAVAAALVGRGLEHWR